MSLPTDRKYTQSHEWVKAEGDVFVVGITDTAQDQLGDLVFVGDVKVGAKLNAGETAGVVESVKAASDIYAPVSIAPNSMPAPCSLCSHCFSAESKWRSGLKLAQITTIG